MNKLTLSDFNLVISYFGRQNKLQIPRDLVKILFNYYFITQIFEQKPKSSGIEFIDAFTIKSNTSSYKSCFMDIVVSKGI